MSFYADTSFLFSYYASDANSTRADGLSLPDFSVGQTRLRDHAAHMTAHAAQLLDQFRKLPPAEQRELCAAILRETARPAAPRADRRKSIADIAGKYRPIPDADTKDHDRGFAEAIAASKV